MLKQFNDIGKNLEILAEECAEVIQIKSKITRFGLTDSWPERNMSNVEALELEIGHVLAMIDILIDQETLNIHKVWKHKQNKFEKLTKWYNYPN